MQTVVKNAELRVAASLLQPELQWPNHLQQECALQKLEVRTHPLPADVCLEDTL